MQFSKQYDENGGILALFLGVLVIALGFVWASNVPWIPTRLGAPLPGALFCLLALRKGWGIGWRGLAVAFLGLGVVPTAYLFHWYS
jgi:hypothetical protein